MNEGQNEVSLKNNEVKMKPMSDVKRAHDSRAQNARSREPARSGGARGLMVTPLDSPKSQISSKWRSQSRLAQPGTDHFLCRKFQKSQEPPKITDSKMDPKNAHDTEVSMKSL